MSELWAGILIGLLSSFHCVGMCGPIALSLPAQPNQSGTTTFVNAFLYNFGRISTYAFLGLLTGWIGRLFFYTGWQQILSITIGILIILGFVLSQKRLHKIHKKLGIEWFSNKLRQGFSRYFNASHKWNFVLIGVLNGLLPCGFVYLAAGHALVLPGGVQNAVLYMVFFGLGTLPVMLFLSVSKSFISLNFRAAIKKVVPYIAVTMGILFVLRGMELGIPYVSPVINYSQEAGQEKVCAP